MSKQNLFWVVVFALICGAFVYAYRRETRSSGECRNLTVAKGEACPHADHHAIRESSGVSCRCMPRDPNGCDDMPAQDGAPCPHRLHTLRVEDGKAICRCR